MKTGKLVSREGAHDAFLFSFPFWLQPEIVCNDSSYSPSSNILHVYDCSAFMIYVRIKLSVGMNTTSSSYL